MTYYCTECHRILSVESTMYDDNGNINNVTLICINHGTITLDDRTLNWKALGDKLNLHIKCNKRN